MHACSLYLRRFSKSRGIVNFFLLTCLIFFRSSVAIKSSRTSKDDGRNQECSKKHFETENFMHTPFYNRRYRYLSVPLETLSKHSLIFLAPDAKIPDSPATIRDFRKGIPCISRAVPPAVHCTI